MKGKRVLYKIEQAYSMLDINVTGEVLRTVSTTYRIIVGKEEARVSVIIAPGRKANTQNVVFSKGTISLYCI